MLVTLVSNEFIPAIKENELFCERDIVEVGVTCCIVLLIWGWVGEGFHQQFMAVSPVPTGGFSSSLSACPILHMPNCWSFVTCKFILLVIHVLQLLWEYLQKLFSWLLTLFHGSGHELGRCSQPTSPDELSDTTWGATGVVSDLFRIICKLKTRERHSVHLCPNVLGPLLPKSCDC